MPTRKLFTVAAAVSGVALLAAACSSSSSGGSSGGSTASSTNASTATSATAFGGMNGLVAACKKEGTLNVITLPANWANYGHDHEGFYKNQVAINGNPTQASAAFSAVYASALANGGSLANIEPGIQYFKKLHQAGNFVPVTAGPTTVQSGQTPIVVWWDYLLASEIQSAVPTFKIVIPTDAHYAAYYSQAISKTAPNPACARLWEEYLYSVTGQNLWLQGKARPIELQTLISNGTVDKAANAALPAAPAGGLNFPTQAQESAAEAKVAQQWSSVIG